MRGKKQSPEIEPHMHCQLIFGKDIQVVEQGKYSLFNILIVKLSVKTLYTKVNSQEVINLNVRAKSTNPVEETMVENPSDIGL